MKTKTVDLQPLTVRAQFKPKSVDSDKRTVELRWTTGSKVKRGGLFTEPFNEELSLDPSHIRLDRLNNGAPLLNSHSSTDLGDQIGVIESASVEKGAGFATARFSEREDVDAIFRDVENGIIRNVSVGYRVHRYEDVSTDDDKIKTLRAVDWEPFELSLVPIGADPGASVRAHEDETNECEIITREIHKEKTMKKNQKPFEKESIEERAEAHVEKDKQAAREEERARCSEISGMVRKFNLGDDLEKDLVEKGVSIDEARKIVIDKVAERSDAPGETRTQIQVVRDEADDRRDGMQEAILNRYQPDETPITEKSRPYANMSLLRMAEECVREMGHDPRGMSKSELAQRGLHTTSDLPSVLANVADKALRKAYELAPQTFRPFVSEGSNTDFKAAKRIQFGEAPKLKKVGEDGEIKYGSIEDSGEDVSLATYGRIVGITRQVIINDDLGAITKLPARFGRSAADLESDLVYGIITANGKLSDNVALFHASHGNLGAAAVIGEASLSEARKKMRLQKGLQSGDDEQSLNIVPKYLIVPAALETTAEKQLGLINPSQSSEVNVFSGKFQIISEARLDANSDKAWYMAADPNQIDTIEIVYLEGQRGVYTETKQGFHIDGIEVKARLDVAAVALDYRGLLKNNGA